MKRIILLAILLIPMTFFAQSDIETIVKEGIALHDAGKYEEAITVYEKALKVDKKSSLVHYEIGFSYFAKGDYKKAIKHMDKVIKKGDKHLKGAYMTKGSSLDVMGKPKDAIKIYKEAIREFPDDYLLHYNLALTQYNLGEKGEAETNLIDGISLNPMHGTSNYLLAIIKSEQGKKVEALLGLHFFLLIEPDSDRSKSALAILKELMGEGVEQKDDNNVEITLSDLDDDNDFAATNLILSLVAASKHLDENKDKSSQELFNENTESIFTILKELKEDKKGIWWDLYVNFYASLIDSGNMEAYCYFVTQTNSELEVKWIEEHEEQMNKFYDWLKG